MNVKPTRPFRVCSVKSVAVGLILLPFLLPIHVQADSLDAVIKASEQELQQKLQTRNELQQQWKAADQKKSDILFSVDAYKKQKGVIQQEMEDIMQRKNALDARYTALAADYDALNAKVQEHNAHQCTETCDQNGRCDGSCNWYNAEKAQLDSEGAALDARRSSLDSQRGTLQNDAQQVETNSKLIDQLRQSISDQTVAWVGRVKHLRSAWDENEAQIKQLQNKLGKLSAIKEKVDTCVRAIPPECDSPYSRTLNGNCEVMKAQCSAIFDGNIPQ